MNFPQPLVRDKQPVQVRPMDKRIRVMLMVLVACFGLLFLQLNNIQIRQAPALDVSQYQPGQTGTNVARGDIVTSDGKIMAESGPSDPNSSLGANRIYPYNDLYADVTGYYDVVDQNSTGLENEYDLYLIRHQPTANSLNGLLTESAGTDTVQTTISSKLQKVAAAAFAPYTEGAVVALDPQTGAILAMYGKPSFNPNKLASHNAAEVASYYNSLNPNSGASPLINLAVGFRIQPGSTFKVITTAAIFDHDQKIASQVFPYLSQLTIPESQGPLHNYGGETCGGNLALILAASCDTAYAKVGLELGASNLAQEAKSFGFNQTPPLDIPSNEIATSCFPPVEGAPYNVPSCPSAPIGTNNIPGIAYSAIGQENVSESALQDALIAGAIGANGNMMTPHLMHAIVNNEGQVVTTYTPHRWLASTSASTANQVRTLMLGVAAHGTAAGLFPANLHVAAKTGTAETGSGNCSSTWLMATAPSGPGETPSIAVAAVVPAQAAITCSETGAEVAGPIVAKVIDAYLGTGK